MKSYIIFIHLFIYNFNLKQKTETKQTSKQQLAINFTYKIFYNAQRENESDSLAVLHTGKSGAVFV